MMHKKIHEKLDQILKNQEIHGRMMEDLLNQLDNKRFNVDRQREALKAYSDNIVSMMKGSGAPQELIDGFKTIFNRNLMP